MGDARTSAWLTRRPDINVRRAAELELRKIESQPGMLASTFQIVTSDNVDLAIRQAAAMCVVGAWWDADSADT